LERAGIIPIHLHSLSCCVHNHFLTDWRNEGASQGYESSSEESVEEENNRDNRDTDESIREDERGTEDNIGDFDTDEEEDGAVTVLKLSNGVMSKPSNISSSIGTT
jgi:hypothetical protein